MNDLQTAWQTTRSRCSSPPDASRSARSFCDRHDQFVHEPEPSCSAAAPCKQHLARDHRGEAAGTQPTTELSGRLAVYVDDFTTVTDAEFRDAAACCVPSGRSGSSARRTASRVNLHPGRRHKEPFSLTNPCDVMATVPFCGQRQLCPRALGNRNQPRLGENPSPRCHCSRPAGLPVPRQRTRHVHHAHRGTADPCQSAGPAHPRRARQQQMPLVWRRTSIALDHHPVADRHVEELAVDDRCGYRWHTLHVTPS